VVHFIGLAGVCEWPKMKEYRSSNRPPFFSSLLESTMEQLNVIQQMAVEKKMLTYLIEGLHNTMAWDIQGDDLSRKLSTLKFITRSFQSHMERLMNLEERDGYMDIVLKTHPQLSKKVEASRQEHDEFRKELKRLGDGFERVSSRDPAAIADICRGLTALLKKVDGHHQQEADLIQEGFEREEGGEG
jgi:hypothetical protein